MAVQPGFLFPETDSSGNIIPDVQRAVAFSEVDSSNQSTYIMFFGLSIQSGIPSKFYISEKRGPVLEVLQNTPKNIYIFMRSIDTGAGIAGIASALTINASKDGSPGVVISPVVTDMSVSLGEGWYTLAMTAGDLDTLNMMALSISSPSAVTNDDVLLNVIAVDKNDPIRMGMTSLPAAAANSVGGLPTITAVGQGPGGQIKSNSVTDNYAYTLGLMTSCRLRVFASKAIADSATDGDSDGARGEVERFRIVVSYNPDGTIKTYKYAKEL